MEHLDLHNYENDDFSDVDELLDLIRPQVNREGGVFDSPDSDSLVTLLGDFLEGQLANLGWSIAELATQTQIDSYFLEDILTGSADHHDITDSVLNQLAQAIGYDPNILRIVMRRDIEPMSPNTQLTPESEQDNHDYATLQHEIEKHLDVITDLFLQTIDNRYSPTTTQHPDKKVDYDLAIKEIQLIIAQHRADVKHVESLLKQLKSAPSAIKQGGDEVDLSRRDISRIIEVIKTESSSIR